MASTVKLLTPDTDVFVALLRHFAEFEKETGHRADVQILGVGDDRSADHFAARSD